MHASAATSTYGMARISRSGTIIILHAARSLTRGAVRAVALARHQPFQLLPPHQIPPPPVESTLVPEAPQATAHRARQRTSTPAPLPMELEDDDVETNTEYEVESIKACRLSPNDTIELHAYFRDGTAQWITWDEVHDGTVVTEAVLQYLARHRNSKVPTVSRLRSAVNQLQRQQRRLDQQASTSADNAPTEEPASLSS